MGDNFLYLQTIEKETDDLDRSPVIGPSSLEPAQFQIEYLAIAKSTELRQRKKCLSIVLGLLIIAIIVGVVGLVVWWKTPPQTGIALELSKYIVTFHQRNATIDLSSFRETTVAEIIFKFKTRIENGTFLQNIGQFQFFETYLLFGHSVHFRFDAGRGTQTLKSATSRPLNDNEWHSVHIERNLKQAVLRVDQQEAVVLDEPTDQAFQTLDTNNAFVIGGGKENSKGFVGCLGGLIINGELMDLPRLVETEGHVTDGVSAGCYAQCASDPCYNGGVCVEWYSHYQCDCDRTPYGGSDCRTEASVFMLPDYMIRVGIHEESASNINEEEKITVGFSTREKQGILIQISNADPVKPEYISVEMNNDGGLTVVVDVGFVREVVTTNLLNVNLADGQPHVANVTRITKEHKLIITVDDYPAIERIWSGIPENAYTRLDNPKYIYFGGNEVTPPWAGFRGCLFRAQYGHMYPLKSDFQHNIVLKPNDGVHRKTCSFEELPNSVEEADIQPTSSVDTSRPRSDMDG